MTKKNYAALKSSQETMAKIEQMAEEVMHKPTSAYATMKQIGELAAKWNKDFRDCDPAWQPMQKSAPTQPSVHQKAVALGAFVQG